MVTIFVYLFNIANMLGVIYTRHMGVIYKRIQKSEKLNKLNNKLIYTNTIQTKTLYPLSASVFPLTHKIIWHLTEWNNKVGHNAKVLTWYLITVRDFLQITRRGTCTYKVPLLKMSKFCLYFSGSCISLDLQLSAHVSSQCGKFVLHARDIRCAILMLSIYLLLNFLNLGHAISKLSSPSV